MVESNSDSSVPTDVILIVKGAGNQQPDDHLNLFLNGFWPAVIRLYKNSSLHQRRELDDLPTPPHDKDFHNHYTEVCVKDEAHDLKHRIWLREAFWEPEVVEKSPSGYVNKEWRMASFAFLNLFMEAFSINWNNDELRRARVTNNSHQETVCRNNTTGLFGYWSSFSFLLWLIFAPPLMPLYKLLIDVQPGFRVGLGALLVLLTAMGLAIPFSLETRAIRRKNPKRLLPALPGWVSFALLLCLVIFPGNYIRVLLALLLLNIAVLLARRLLWAMRPLANSDTDPYLPYAYKDDGKLRIGRVNMGRWTFLINRPILYRYLVFMVQPIFYLGWRLISLLKWTRILSGVGTALEKFARTGLAGYLGDVVSYAMNPSQAQRIRGVIEGEIRYFSDHPRIQRIHIVAHSQGTPITYETLFNHLEPKYQEKIYTYITLGSVLSYYHQARGVLDPVYHDRFPVSAEKPQNFPIDFKWMNFWNFTDLITEFMGLDGYVRFTKAPVDPASLKYTGKVVRSPTSPTNIKTRDSFATNHGEYWTNLDKLQVPFARRILDNLPEGKPPEWKPDRRIKPRLFETLNHHTRIQLVFALITCLILLSTYSITRTSWGTAAKDRISTQGSSWALNWINEGEAETSEVDNAADSAHLVCCCPCPPPEGISRRDRLAGYAETWRSSRPAIVSTLLAVMAVVITLDVLGQVGRTLGIQPEENSDRDTASRETIE
jgi:hypothetical protein